MHGSSKDYFLVIRILWLNKVITYLLTYDRKTKNSFKKKSRKTRLLISFIFIHLIFTSWIKTKTNTGSARRVTGICKFPKTSKTCGKCLKMSDKRSFFDGFKMQHWWYIRPVSHIVPLPCRTQLIKLNSPLARQ